MKKEMLLQSGGFAKKNMCVSCGKLFSREEKHGIFSMARSVCIMHRPVGIRCFVGLQNDRNTL
jgi:hypothetical protein